MSAGEAAAALEPPAVEDWRRLAVEGLAHVDRGAHAASEWAERVEAAYGRDLTAARAPNQFAFTIPVVTPLLNDWQRMHYTKRTKIAKALAWEVHLATVGRRPAAPWPLVELDVTRYARGTLPDWDAVYGGAKALIDALIPLHPKVHPHGLGLIADDSPLHIARYNAWPRTVELEGAERTEVLITILEAE